MIALGLFNSTRDESKLQGDPAAASSRETESDPGSNPSRGMRPRQLSNAAAAPAAEEIVARKLSQFALSRLELANALARRHNVQLSEDVKRFFAAVESGKWDEIEAAYKVINGGDSSAGQAEGRSPDLQHFGRRSSMPTARLSKSTNGPLRNSSTTAMRSWARFGRAWFMSAAPIMGVGFLNCSTTQAMASGM